MNSPLGRDVVREYVDAFRQEGLEVMLYYSIWSRISYEDVPFPEIYAYIKSLQPECLVMDLNAAKYPREALFYTDIKSYEQGAGQKISTTENQLPALACLPLQQSWFWKESFPTDQLKSPQTLVNEMIIPYGKAHCNFILNVAPNRDGLMDRNTIEALQEIGRLWENDGHVSKNPGIPSTRVMRGRMRKSSSIVSLRLRLML